MSSTAYVSKLHKMSENIQVLDSYQRANIGIIQGLDSTLIVDTGHNEEHVSILFSHIDKKKVDYAVLTHYHEDHTLGLSYLDCVSVAHFNTTPHLVEYKSLDWSNEGLKKRIEEGTLSPNMLNWFDREYPDRSKLVFKTPNIIYKNRMEIDLGNQIVELKHIDCDHTNDTTIVYVPNEESLFLGDCLSPSNKLIIKIKTFRKMLIDFLAYDSKIMVEGHGPPLGNGEGNNYLIDLATITDFVEEYGKESTQKIDIIMSKMKLFDRDSVAIYLPFFINGI
jgi:glyoxylase-like metal-dependent hydrolase (beta-lactamase superfamily II)